MREPPSGAALARQLSSRACLTPPLSAARRFRKLSIIERGVHQAERNPGNEGFRMTEAARQPRPREAMAGDLARPTLPFVRQLQ